MFRVVCWLFPAELPAASTASTASVGFTVAAISGTATPSTQHHGACAAAATAASAQSEAEAAAAATATAHPEGRCAFCAASGATTAAIARGASAATAAAIAQAADV